MHGSMETTEERATTSAVSVAPSVFDFADYRTFLRAALLHRQTKNPAYSESAFLRQAGFGQNSRGYFGLVIGGKRNLSSKSSLGFAQALKLSEKETSYFENLVLYNQAQTEREKTLYFSRIAQIIRGKETRAFELMKSQYNHFHNWYSPAIYELVAFPDFKEDPEWIIKKLRNSVSTKEVRSAIDDLLNLGLLLRNSAGALVQVSEVIRFSDSSLNYTVVNALHAQILNKAEKSLLEDPYEDRSASCVMMACDANSFSAIREEIKEFRKMILEKYGTKPNQVNAVLNLAIQLFHLTPVPKRTDPKSRG